MTPSLVSRAMRRAAPVVALLVAAACASSSNSNGVSQVRAGGGRGDRYHLTPAELTTAGATNLYDAIVKLRPDYLRQRGASISAEPVQASTGDASASAPLGPGSGQALIKPTAPIKVYVNEQLMTGVEDLRQIPIGQVVDVRFVPGPQAAVRYGTNHGNGAIFVTAKQ